MAGVGGTFRRTIARAQAANTMGTLPTPAPATPVDPTLPTNKPKGRKSFTPTTLGRPGQGAGMKIG